MTDVGGNVSRTRRSWPTVGRVLVGVSLLACLARAGVGAQTTGPTLPPLAIDSLAGRDSFERYCASCHGVTGRGDGPVAASMQVRPSDLTALASRNGGTFPTGAVRRAIEGVGRQPTAHGPATMPVWGVAFRALERSDARAGVRIDNLVKHVESLQTKGTQASRREDPRSRGAQLFRVHCASCHGSDGAGNGPMAALLRKPPPNLTRYTFRNGGVFPSEQLQRVIDGRGVPSHGSGDMPVWGDVFRLASGDAAEVRARIAAIVAFLESIQSRPAE